MDINNNKGHRKHTNLWKRNSILMNDNCMMREIKKEILKFLELSENEESIVNTSSGKSEIWCLPSLAKEGFCLA